MSMDLKVFVVSVDFNVLLHPQAFMVPLQNHIVLKRVWAVRTDRIVGPRMRSKTLLEYSNIGHRPNTQASTCCETTLGKDGEYFIP